MLPIEVAGNYIKASAALNQTAIRNFAFAPSVAAARDNTRDIIGRMVKLGFLDPTTNADALLDRIFVPITPELAVAPTMPSQLPKTGGAPWSISAGAGVTLLGLGLLARRARG